MVKGEGVQVRNVIGQTKLEGVTRESNIIREYLLTTFSP